MQPHAARAQLAARGWPVAGAPGAALAYFALVEAGVAVLVADQLSALRPGGLSTLLLLVAIAVGYEESARRATRLRIRLSAPLRTDMTSVWGVAGAIVLRPPMALVLLGCVLTYDWLRQWRPSGEALYRKLFVIASMLLACFAAGVTYRFMAGTGNHGFWALSLPAAVVGTLAVYTAVNRALVTIGMMMLAGVRGRMLLGTRDDNLVEFATLCLGGLVGVAVVYQPWLALLVFAPLVTLQRGALARELESAASVDAKTGLLNATTWEQVAHRELSRGERVGSRTGVVIVDLDRFKSVNDQFGHLAGDRVLRGVGKCIEACVREYDTVGRFGGEEFVAVLPEIDEGSALVVAERIRARVSELTVGHFVESVTEPVPLSVSVGVACTPTDGLELPDLLHAADGALYAAKAAGRNRVRLALRGSGPARTSVEA